MNLKDKTNMIVIFCVNKHLCEFVKECEENGDRIVFGRGLIQCFNDKAILKALKEAVAKEESYPKTGEQ